MHSIFDDFKLKAVAESRHSLFSLPPRGFLQLFSVKVSSPAREPFHSLGTQPSGFLPRRCCGGGGGGGQGCFHCAGEQSFQPL